MAILWVMLGLCLGFLIATIRSRAIDSENERLRASIARIRSALLLGNLRYAVSEVDRALENEAA